MSYQLYVTGGYGFTEAILPTLLHPSNAVDIARDYFTRGYQGQHIDLPPDADVSHTGNLTDTQKQTLLEDLQEGRLVLSSRYEPGFDLFTETQANPDTLRSDLPPTLRQRLQQHWPGRSRGGATAARSDSLAPANESSAPSPEPPAPAAPVPGAGPYRVTLAYRWLDGTGVAGLPFTLATDDEEITGTLDPNGEAHIEGLNGRFAFVRLSSDASDDEVGQQRRAIQHALTEVLKHEQREADALEREYQQMPWHQRMAVSTGAAFQGGADAGIGLLQFVDSMADLASPSQSLMDGLKAAWIASENSSDASWYESYRANYNETRHKRWVEALGFNPTDISREDVAEAYELTNLVMADPILRESLNDFVAEYASIQHHTEVTYLTGAVAFDLILMAVLAVATGGAAAVGAAAGRIRHAGLLASLGKTVKAYCAAVRRQRLRYLWRSTDLKKKNHLEARASKRVEGQELKPAKNVPNKFGEVYAKAPAAKLEIDTIADEIAEMFGGQVAKAPIKSQDRATQKIMNDYDGDATKIKDLARNTIIVSPEKMDAVAAELAKRGANVKVINGTTDPLGYSGVNSTIKTQAGIFGEVQVNTPAMIYARAIVKSGVQRLDQATS